MAARPKGLEAKNVLVAAKVPRPLKDKITVARGGMTESDWLRRLITKELTDD